MPTEHAIIAFDGLSLSGKTTFSQMLLERSPNAVLIRENESDPYRDMTSFANKVFKESVPYEKQIAAIKAEYPQNATIVDDAVSYVRDLGLEGPTPHKKRQATLAYFFARGRKEVNKEVEQAFEKGDVILDRWIVSGWAYQTQPPIDCEDDPYTWRHIKALNDDMGIWYPYAQVIVSCPVDQIPARRAYRQKQGSGTSGQMSTGREHIIQPVFEEIHKWLLENGIPPMYIENAGSPTEKLEDQIRQALPAYLKIEGTLHSWIYDPVVYIHQYDLTPQPLSLREAEEFFLRPDVLERIHKRQTSARFP